MEEQLKIDRHPVVADRFYPGSEAELKHQLKKLFDEADVLVDYDQFQDKENLMAIISPHAGYVFSGIVSASAFHLLKHIDQRKHIFLIGSSHHIDINGASVYNAGDYITPMGKVRVDTDLAKSIIGSSPYFTFEPKAHASEHSLEVQLPFLQYVWENNLTIVPIIIATQSAGTCKKIAEIISPYFTEDNLFIISTDFSHYPDYADAVKVDKLTSDAILTMNPEHFLDQLNANRKEKIPNLSTSICGWTSVLTMMYITENQPYNYEPILYQNSGDAKVYGDHNRVVGYQSFAVYSKKKVDEFALTQKEKEALLDLARSSIEEYLWNGNRLTLNSENFSPKLQTKCGAFVSLYIDNKLRGCVGRITGSESLLQTVRDMAISSAFYDHRFSALTKEEFRQINIEISVLTPLKKIDDINAIELGKHGIYMKKGMASGTFLPQVANKTDWSVEEFLGHCAENKARIGWNGWKEAELFTYEALVFGESE